MSALFATMLALVHALMEDGRRGFAVAWTQRVGLSWPALLVHLRSLTLAHWDRWLALGLTWLALLWLVVLGWYQHERNASFWLQPVHCVAEMPPARRGEVAPIPLNLDRLSRRMLAPLSPYGHYLEGEVNLLVKIDARGRCVGHRLLASDHPQLTRAVLDQLEGLLCLPAREGALAVSAWIPARFVFSLQGRLPQPR